VAERESGSFTVVPIVAQRRIRLERQLELGRDVLGRQCSSARHPTGHPLLLTHRRGHGLSVGLDERTRDTQCSPAGGSDTRSCCTNDRMHPH
jgi:hypothetical protein